MIRKVQQHTSFLVSVRFLFVWMFFGISRSGSFYTRSICRAFEVSSSHKRTISKPFSRLSTGTPVRGISAQLQQNKMGTTDDDSTLFFHGENGNSKRFEATLVSVSEIESCGLRLREGNLVAFPTETVYGLGCNALDPSAIIKVFEAKERPLTDPLISHVTDNGVAYALWNAGESSLEGKALRCLCDKFWPGPLTLVARAAPHVPDLLMANTGFVACRSPQHPISIALINAAQVPIAAPSANKFGHVSPTRASHVWDDLKYEDVWIVDTDEKETASICSVGVESSVAKIEMLDNMTGRITLLRQGAVCVTDIQNCLNQAGLAPSFVVEAKTKKATNETVAHVAPGQTIRHYSPDIPSFILSEAYCKESPELSPDDVDFLSKTVIIDFRGKLRKWKDRCIAYRELSESGDSSLATKAVFETLRWAERVVNADQIIFPEIAEDEPGKDDALVLALKDRLTRAASGVVIDNLKVKH